MDDVKGPALDSDGQGGASNAGFWSMIDMPQKRNQYHFRLDAVVQWCCGSSNCMQGIGQRLVQTHSPGCSWLCHAQETCSNTFILACVGELQR